MEKLRFEFTLLPGTDGKTNVYSIISISTCDNKIYGIPEELQPVLYHKEISKTNTYSKVKSSLTKRYQVRRIWFTMTEELSKIYIDEDGNLQFGGQYLEEISPEPSLSTTSVPVKDTDALEKLFAKFLEHTSETKGPNLKTIAERFAIEKFTSKHINAVQWIDIFEKECSRFGVLSDENKIEILRFFMDKSCSDWYSSMVIKLTMDSEWSIWKNKFCESFTHKGWNTTTFALQFKYKEGSLLDYCLRKEKLLLEMRKSIDTGTLVDLIAAGLPEYILNKIDRESLTAPEDLFNEVTKYEHMVNKKQFLYKKRVGNFKSYSQIEERVTCKICEKLGKGTRYHPETTCWFGSKDETKINKNYVKHVNSAVIEAAVNETYQKNL